jgi:hypothetical protein
LKIFGAKRRIQKSEFRSRGSNFSFDEINTIHTLIKETMGRCDVNEEEMTKY